MASTPHRPAQKGTEPDARHVLRAASLTSTPQRRAIWSLLAKRRDHPTADQVFESLGSNASGISRTTVYRTLEAFVGAGLAQRVGHLGAAARYDARTERHHHFLCEECGSIHDVEPAVLEDLCVRDAALCEAGFEVREVSLVMRGRCADCARR